MMTAVRFDYHVAFSRNIGWVTRIEQNVLRGKRVAIAGLGGVGGSHLLTLTRLGIGAFHLADLDNFELANFNRQAGAFRSTVDEPKVDVLARMARDINPELELELFGHGIDADNMQAFLAGVDLYIDGIDFFALEARRAVFAACAERGIPAITAAPLGMGVALLNFMPGRMGFEQYFRLKGQPETEQLLRFLLGLSPSGLHAAYLVEPGAIDLAHHQGPSTAMACELCAGVAGAEALKILLGRGGVIAAPRGLQFDAYRNRLVISWLPWGNNNPLQRLRLALARRHFKGRPPAPALTPNPRPVAEQILDLARWAPSGDNTQPWRFEIMDDRRIVVHGHDTREHCVYDLQGHASQLSLGALLETITIAASAHGLRTQARRRRALPETTPTFDVAFTADSALPRDPLLPYITIRSVQRRSMHTRALTDHERTALADAVGPGYRVVWLAGLGQRLRMALLKYRNAGLRLTMPEAYQVHRDIIAWNTRFSEDRIPDLAIGASWLTRRLMRWAMHSWGRVAFMNRYLGGTLMPRIELDLLPGLACAAYFVILAEHKPVTIDDFVAAGRAVQRFWLTATHLGLYVQPELTPLVFHRYVTDGIEFSTCKGMDKKAQGISRRLRQVIGETGAELGVFMGRIGAGPPPSARSTRLPLERLLIRAAPKTQKQGGNRVTAPAAGTGARPGQ